MRGDVCMTSNCGLEADDANGRGLCPVCFKTARSLVKSGHTTWERLENAGFVLKKKKGPFMEAFEKLEAPTKIDKEDHQ